MERIAMSYAQIEAMVAKQDGYNTVTEWKADLADFYTSIYDLVDVQDMGFCRDGATRYYLFERADGKPAVWFRR